MATRQSLPVGLPRLSEKGRTAIVLALLTLGGAFVRLYGLGAWDYYHDEIWHVYIARQPTVADIFYADLTLDGHPFLPYLLWHYALELWNDPWMARLPSLISGVLLIPASYFLGKELFGHRGGGLFLAFFMAFSGLMIEQSDVVRAYMLMLLFCTIAVWSVYHYRRTPHLGYLLIYFIATGLSLLSEFIGAPITAFTALYLLDSMVRRRPRPWLPIAVWALIHFSLLAYLLWFKHILFTIGNVDFSHSVYFSSKRHTSLLIQCAGLVWHYVNFIFTASIASLLPSAWGSETLAVISFIVFFGIFLGGIAWLIRGRHGWFLLWIALTILVSVAFIFLELAPIDRSRRDIAFIMPYSILLYGGCANLLGYIGWRPRPLPTVLVCTALLTLAYAWGSDWRMFRPYEFQQTRTQTQEIFNFLDAHVGKDDLILTDPSSFFHFWNRGKNCPLVASMQTVSEYSCYRAPIFVANDDMRTGYFLLNLASVQKKFEELDERGRLRQAKNIWLVGIQHIDVKTCLLYPQYRMWVLNLLPISWRRRPEVGGLISEQEAFARHAYSTALFKKIHYAYACGVDNNAVHIGEDNGCLMNFVAVALPKADIYRQFIHHPPYTDLITLIRHIEKTEKSSGE